MQKDSISIISISFSKSKITFKTIECTLMYFDKMLSGENSLADWTLVLNYVIKIQIYAKPVKIVA